MNKKVQIAKYLIADYLAAFIAWSIFFIYRKQTTVGYIWNNIEIIYTDPKFYYGLLFIPVFWICLYLAVGMYVNVYRKSRLKELSQTLIISLIGIVVIFFAIILDDIILTYKNYYKFIIVLFMLHFGITYLFKHILTSITARKIKKGKIGFNTIIVGSNGNAVSIYEDIINEPKASGNIIIGFINAAPYKNYKLESYIKHLGDISDLKKIILDNNVEDVIVAIERTEIKTLEKIITEIETLPITIKVIPDVQDYLLGTIKSTSIFHTPLLLISPELMPYWQQTVKRFMDISISIIAMILLLPVYFTVAILIKIGSKGPVFYKQERIGLHGAPFTMIKFRSMYVDAEKEGIPKLSSKSDQRITKIGKFLRKVRLDEIPQFWSVLIGDMSLVGPRPERQFFIDKIVEVAPHYKLLQKIKPGITSWGQVKYGYAESIEQMVERLKFDILYIENMSIAMDIKILIYTVLIVIQGRGK